jgi:hypothetical protein
VRYEKRRSAVVSKYTTKGIQPLNGKMMYMDFPFKRPVYYKVELENGDTLEVSVSDYGDYRIGERVSYCKEIWETEDYLFLTVIIILVILYVAFLISIA